MLAHDCMFAPARFVVQSLSTRATAYAEAVQIAAEITQFMDDYPNGLDDPEFE